MPSYTVTVATGSQWFAGTDDYVYLSLEGTAGCSERHLLDKPFYNDFERGAVDSYDVTVEEDLGEIQLIKIEKRKYWYQDDWYLKYVTVKTPMGDYLEFPCYRWITDEKEVVLRDGRAKLPRDDKTQILKQHRRKELEIRQKTYRWKEWHPGFPLSIDAHSHSDLPRDIQFDNEKGIDFILNYSKAMENLYVNRFMHMFQSSWSDFADFERIFVRISNTISEYVMQHWKEDFMFGYQFLNGCNPVLIRRCAEIPKKLPVTTDMVECSLERNLTLEEEAKQGNIFIVDYELLDGVDANKTDPCTIQYLAAPICLLYKNLENKIVPIAIQLGQKPGPDNPIFLPSDATYDWLLAKIWVRSSDFHIHQTVTHLLRTHLVSEVFSIAMFRQLPAVHPLFKLLVPHMRFTIAINTKAREQLICECGLFDKYDWCSWIPNAPPTMRRPPPTEKGTVTIEQIVESLPDRGRSCWHLGAVWALSQFQDNELFLGTYPDEHFVEKPVKEAMATFRKNLDEIVNTITERNKNKKLPYYYLSPDRIPNSVAV
ncbi:polyunsaturated fatty acid 5-lipoxygenase isoform X3 [Grus americana]|uniref:polyunsaturated fatty acid 5-lipoxygenase isoform X3 n=1 Tax=Grus americana TaxID=9117 RepID=UPI00240833DF|nr:polyunsaturated fatty acid 5-lipoxygenase isoform X3 [Grus americana]